MNKLVQLKNAFLSGQISKGDYISEMSVEHEHLFSYSEFLNGVNIEEIRLRKDAVIAELKNPRISMICMGYGCFVIKGGCLESCPCVTEQTTDTNYLFLHGEKHAEIIAGWAQ